MCPKNLIYRKFSNSLRQSNYFSWCIFTYDIAKILWILPLVNLLCASSIFPHITLAFPPSFFVFSFQYTLLNFDSRLYNKTENVRVTFTQVLTCNHFCSGKTVCYIFWLCICSLRQSAWSAHAPYCHLWPARLYNIFPHYLINCGAGEGWRRSVGPIMWEMKKCYLESMSRGISYMK